jgi:hypothetical protein
MYGISETIRKNLSTPLPEREGAYVARAVELLQELSPDEIVNLQHNGIVPEHLLDSARAQGFDDFLLAKACREALDTVSSAKTL